MYYFVHDVTEHLYRSRGPGDAAKWIPKNRQWASMPDPDGHWLWRAWGFGGYTNLSAISESEARQRWPDAFRWELPSAEN